MTLALGAIRREIDPKASGSAQRNRARLRQFDDDENLRRLINLTETILRALPRSGQLSYAGAVKLQSALAIAILLVAPMRAKNLGSLRLDRHLAQTRPGGVHIVIPAEEVKNRTPLSFEASDSGRRTPGPLSRPLSAHPCRGSRLCPFSQRARFRRRRPNNSPSKSSTRSPASTRVRLDSP